MSYDDHINWSLEAYPARKRQCVRPVTQRHHTTAMSRVTELHIDSSSTSTSSQSSSFVSSSSRQSLALPLIPCSTDDTDGLAAVDLFTSAMQNYLSQNPLCLQLCMTVFVPSEATQHKLEQEIASSDLLSSRTKLVVRQGEMIDTNGLMATSDSFLLLPTDWRFTMNAPRWLKRINEACDNRLVDIARARHTKGDVGKSYLIELNKRADISSNDRLLDECSLARSGVQSLIFCVPPCINKQRIDFIADGKKRNELVQNCYVDAFRQFQAAATTSTQLMSNNNSHPPVTAAISVVTEDVASLKYNPPSTPIGMPFDRNVLFSYIRNPAARTQAVQRAIFYETADFVLVYDAYPKARVHLLVMSKKETEISGIRSLTQHHLPMLQHMQRLALSVVDVLKRDPVIAEATKGCFKLGFHAIPSLMPLHLHLISSDFDSSALKSKKHFNSFTTEFFVDIRIVMNALAHNARPDVMKSDVYAEKMLKGEMRCHHIGCEQVLTNIPQLKSHLKTCQKPLASDMNNL